MGFTNMGGKVQAEVIGDEGGIVMQLTVNPPVLNALGTKPDESSIMVNSPVSRRTNLYIYAQVTTFHIEIRTWQ
jgi:hypothetical protein